MRDDLLTQLLATFANEANEHLERMTSVLLELESAGEPGRHPELVEVVFRATHSLKGAARAVDQRDVEELCQALEGVFRLWLDGSFEAQREDFDLLQQAMDIVRKLLEGESAADSAEAADCVISLLALCAARTPGGPVPARCGSLDEKATAAQAGPAFESGESVRIDVSRLQRLFHIAEELVEVKGTFAGQLNDQRAVLASLARRRGEAGGAADLLDELARDLDEQYTTARTRHRRLEQLTEALLEGTRQTLMVPCRTLLERFRKVVRDLARDLGKEIRLELSGEEVEMDRRILQRLSDPLNHLARNACDHGIEPPGERVEAGKNPTGTVRLTVRPAGREQVEVIVEDDGRGIAGEAVRQLAVKQGVLTSAQAENLADEEAVRLVFASGLSTSRLISQISGRGLGMAIVEESVVMLGGAVTLDSKPGKGTAVRLELPVSLATFSGVLVEAEGERFVIPAIATKRVVKLPACELRTVEGSQTAQLDGRTVGVVRLASTLGLAATLRTDGEEENVNLVVLGAGQQQAAFIVDRVWGQSEGVSRGLGPQLARVRNVTGAINLPTGELVLVLHAQDLLRSAVSGMPQPVAAAGSDIENKPVKVLVVDDSVTSRLLLKNVLEASGYYVTTAVDGAEALATLRTGDFDLLVSDVEMPRMDGFELTSRVRMDRRLAALPTVLVTALESREDRERGIEAGADAYIGKSGFDNRNLLDVIRRLV